MEPAFGPPLDRIDYRRVRVAEQHRAMSEPVVDVSVAVTSHLYAPTFRSTKMGKGWSTRARCVYPPGTRSLCSANSWRERGLTRVYSWSTDSSG